MEIKAVNYYGKDLFGTASVELEMPVIEAKTWYPKLLHNI